jgi:Secretion system C-terminal sorting domain
MKIPHLHFLLSLCLLPMAPSALGQLRCADPLAFSVLTQPGRIEWQKFPEFTLPFPVIFGGPRLGDVNAQPLKHGFSQIVFVQDSEFYQTVQPNQRALEWSGFAFGLNQPWETAESPWNNNITAYRARWNQWLLDVSGGQKTASGKYNLQAARMMVDIERIQETDTRILKLKTDPTTPAAYKNLTDSEFLLRYKRDIVGLYAQSLQYIRNNADLSNVPLSTYGDVPIRNTYLNVIGNSWADWTTNPARVHYLVQDTTSFSRANGPFEQQLDYLTPSAYYFYDYPNRLAPDYLAYLLFQVEANRAWSSKPVLPFVWMRYHDSGDFYPNFIQPFMAEATAIFPFFSGAKGLWLWDVPGFTDSKSGIYRPNDVFAAYEHFVHGLYRLSKFADMFTGSYELVIETPARDLMDTQKPVWRGVVKDNKILIAAQNPYATETQTTNVVVRYKNWQQIIVLTGRQTYLCQFDLSVTATDPITAEVQISPNPAQTSFTISLAQPLANTTPLSLHNLSGQMIRQTVMQGQKAEIDVRGLATGVYILRIGAGAEAVRRRVLVLP